MTARTLAKANAEQDIPIYYYNYRFKHLIDNNNDSKNGFCFFRHRGDVTLLDQYEYDPALGDMGVGHADDIFMLFPPQGRQVPVLARSEEALSVKTSLFQTAVRI